MVNATKLNLNIPFSLFFIFYSPGNPPARQSQYEKCLTSLINLCVERFLVCLKRY